MCGRYVVKTPVSRLAKMFDLIGPRTLFPRFNVAPT
jgi:putative SOS response-associated peptidase YedK